MGKGAFVAGRTTVMVDINFTSRMSPFALGV